MTRRYMVTFQWDDRTGEPAVATEEIRLNDGWDTKSLIAELKKEFDLSSSSSVVIWNMFKIWDVERREYPNFNSSNYQKPHLRTRRYDGNR